MSRPAAHVPAVALLVAASTALAADPAEAPSDLRSSIDKLVGAPVHGTLSNRYRLRWTNRETDQDMFQTLDLRVGDASKDVVTGALFVRSFEDLDHAHENEHGSVFRSIDDVFGKSVNALLYTAYADVRPTSGAVESFRVGRQYVFVEETFHVDGVQATTRPLVESIQLTVTGYAGVPVHFYESSASGDWLGGVRIAADPWKAGRAAIDYSHVQDRFSLLGHDEKNDLAALSVWQGVGDHVELYGQFEWLDGPRDATLRATANFPEQDLLVQARYYRLLEKESKLATEFDPFTNVMQDVERFQQAELRVAKGFGDHFDVEAGAMDRRLLPGEGETAFNRDVHRLYLTPTLTDWLLDGNSLSFTGERLDGGDGERIRTWGAEMTQRVGAKTKFTIGTDYSLYGYGPLASEERTHVRTVFARAKFPLTKALSADVRYSWERNDLETFHVLTLALVLDF